MKTKALIFLFLASLAFNYGCKSKARLVGIDDMPKERIKQIKEFLDNHDAYAYIPATTKIIRNVKGDITDTVKVDEFFISKTEVSNAAYLEFIDSVRQKHGKDSAQALLPDTTVWSGALLEKMKMYYLRHQAYQTYPVTGVTHRQAELYCQWLTEVFAKEQELPFKKVSFSLPTEEEWEHAASGGDQHIEYPWGGPYTINSDGKFMANFYSIKQGAVYRDSLGNLTIAQSRLFDGPQLFKISATAPVRSYYTNDFGLYCLAGNVEEMLKTEGIAKGGSWRDPGHYLRISVRNHYQPGTADNKRGFRVVMYMNE